MAKTKRTFRWYIKMIILTCRNYIASSVKIHDFKLKIKEMNKKMKVIKSYKVRRDLYEKDYLSYINLIEVGKWERKDTLTNMISIIRNK